MATTKKTFIEIKEELVKSGRLYEDADFPATQRSMSKDGSLGDAKCKWLRPPVSIQYTQRKY